MNFEQIVFSLSDKVSLKIFRIKKETIVTKTAKTINQTKYSKNE